MQKESIILFRYSKTEVETSFIKESTLPLKPVPVQIQVGRNALRSEPRTEGKQMAGPLASLIVDWKGTSDDDLMVG